MTARRIRLGLFVLALLPACSSGGQGCNGSCAPIITGSTGEDFESLCGGAPCGAVTTGATSIVPSLLPGDHALALEAGATVTWNWSVPGYGRDTRLAVTARCDGGGDLRCDGDGTRRLMPPEDSAAAASAWTQHVWTLELSPVPATMILPSAAMNDPNAMHPVTVTLRNAGTARCTIDLVRFTDFYYPCTPQ